VEVLEAGGRPQIAVAKGEGEEEDGLGRRRFAQARDRM